MPRTAVYRQIMDDIRAAIARGDVKPGDQLRTIDQFARDYECSTTPVKYALKLLDAAGVIEIRQGVGSFVATPDQDR